MNWFIHIFRAAGYSLEGLRAALRTEIALQQEVVVLLGLLIIVPLSGLDFLTGAFVLFSWVMVMAVELINSAIEATLNRFGTNALGQDLLGQSVGDTNFISNFFTISQPKVYANTNNSGTATVGALFTSIVLSGAKWLYGHVRDGRYYPGMFNVVDKLR